jgi:hypothetical protein
MADKCAQRGRHVILVSAARSPHPGRSAANRLVGAGEQHWGNVEVKRARRLQIEHKFELGRLQDRKVRWFGALEDAAGIDADLAERVHKIGP